MLRLSILFLLQGPILYELYIIIFVVYYLFILWYIIYLFYGIVFIYLSIYLLIFLFTLHDKRVTRAVTTAVYGRIMKIESTKIRKKLQGAEANIGELGDERCRVPNPL